MATPVYPATNNAEAIELNISNANQFFTVLQGSIDDFIMTYEGYGEIPSVAKAMHEAAAYKPPLLWQTTGEETDLLQPRVFEGGAYAPLQVPAPFSERPSNNHWRLLQTNVVKSNTEATTDPTVNDDETKGYSVNSLWINKSTEDVFRCLDATAGEAVWVQSSFSVEDLGALALGDTAADVPYDNTASGLSAENTQSAIDEVAAAVEAIGIDSLDDIVPPGVIWMWSGSIPDIPPGWALCDGSNGTPDLRNRFVAGAGGSYAVGDTGGADSVALTVQQMPAHNHTASTGSAGGHSHSGSTNTTGAHTHSYTTHYLGSSAAINGRFSTYRTNGGATSGHTGSIASGGAHAHSLSVNSNGAHTHTVSIANRGGGQAHENRPPYYALAYIMRLAWS